MYHFDSCPDRKNLGSLKWERYADKSILPLWVADMDFETAPKIVQALEARLKHGVFGYTIPYDSVHESVIQYLSKSHSYEVKEEWLHFLPGLVPAINLCCHAFTEATDSVMTLTPVYPPFLSAPKYAKRELITVPLSFNEKNQWTFDFEAMEKAIRPDTKLFILCNPHNPVGRVYTKEELTQLSNFIEKHDLILISDEIHCDLILESSSQHIVSATIDENLAQRTITLMAPSKTYNLPGLACAFSIIQDPKKRTQFEKTIRGIITEINCFGYAACDAAYRYGEPWRIELIRYLNNNYSILKSFIEESMPQIVFKPMQATYLAWLNTSQLNIKSPTQFFEKHGIGLSDGTPFGDSNYVRLNFGCPKNRLIEGLERMHEALKKEGNLSA